jgi:hypothetical protein
MNDLERSVRETLTAWVSHLTDERLGTGTLDADTSMPIHQPQRHARALLLPAAAAAAVAAVVVGAFIAVNSGPVKHAATTAPATTAAAAQPPLVGTWWRLESVKTAGHAYQVQQPTDSWESDYYIRFDDDHSFHAHVPCNQGDGTATVVGDEVGAFHLRDPYLTAEYSAKNTLVPADNVCRRLAEHPELVAPWMRALASALPALDHGSVADGKLQLSTRDRSSTATLTFWEDALAYRGDDTFVAGGHLDTLEYRIGYQEFHGRLEAVMILRRPDQLWLEGGHTSTGVSDRYAACSPLGHLRDYLLGWASSKATKVVVEPPVGPAATLKLYPIPALHRSVYGGAVRWANPDKRAQLIVYGDGGQVISQTFAGPPWCV